MNYKFNISNVQVSAPDAMVDVKIGEIAIEVTDLNIMESLKVAKELPSIIRDLRVAVETPLTPVEMGQSCGISMPPLGAIIAEAMMGAFMKRDEQSADGELNDDEEVESVEEDAKA